MSEAQEDLTPAVQDAAVEKRKGDPPVRYEYTSKEIALIAKHYCSGAPQDRVELFLAVAAHRGLNPFKREIHLIPFYDKNTDTTSYVDAVGIDGLRKDAERSGNFLRIGPPQWCGDDGVWKDVWLLNTPPAAARIAIFKKGDDQPTIGIALFKEFSKGHAMWKTMPSHMLAKCAEAQALRKAFPDIVEGLYITEEFGQVIADASGGGAEIVTPEKPTPPVELPKYEDFDTEYDCPLCKKGKLFMTHDCKYPPSYKCNNCGKFINKIAQKKAKLPDPKSVQPLSAEVTADPRDEQIALFARIKSQIPEAQLVRIVNQFGVVGGNLNDLKSKWDLAKYEEFLKECWAAIEENGGEPQ